MHSSQPLLKWFLPFWSCDGQSLEANHEPDDETGGTSVGLELNEMHSKLHRAEYYLYHLNEGITLTCRTAACFLRLRLALLALLALLLFLKSLLGPTFSPAVIPTQREDLL